MCLSTVWPKKKQKEWLKKRKSPLIVYSMARARYGKYYPRFIESQSYKVGVNESNRKYKTERVFDANEYYVPHFHRCISIKDAIEMGLGRGVVLKWRCYKKYITAIGNQWGQTVIIARKLTLLGEVKKKPKKSA